MGICLVHADMNRCTKYRRPTGAWFTCQMAMLLAPNQSSLMQHSEQAVATVLHCTVPEPGNVDACSALGWRCFHLKLKYLISLLCRKPRHCTAGG